MRFERAIRTLYSEPWLILETMHGVLCDVLQNHISGDAHRAGFLDAFEEKAEPTTIIDEDGIATVMVNGVIGHKVSGIEKSSGVVDSGDIRRELEAYAKDPEIRGVLLSIDSPGGQVTGTPELGAAVSALRDVKPVFAHTDGLMASAAYWVGSSANAIYATPSATVGSIGTYLALLDTSKAYEMQGVKPEVIKAGKFKAAGVPGTSLTEDQRENLQAGVDHINEHFRDHVASHRPRVEAETMEGQTFFADQALDVGLVDQLGSLEDAREALLAYIG